LQTSSHPVVSPQLQHAVQAAQQHQQQQLAPKPHAPGPHVQQLQQHHSQPQAHHQAAGAPPPFGADSFVNSAMATYSERVANPPSMPGTAATAHQSACNPLTGTTNTSHPMSAHPPEYSAEAVAVAASVLPGQEIAGDGAFGVDSAAYSAGVAYTVSDDCGQSCLSSQLSSQLASQLVSSHPNGSGSTMPSISAPQYGAHNPFAGYAPSGEPYADPYVTSAEQALSPEQTLSPSLLG